MNQDAGKINLVFAADTSDVEQRAERIETVLNQTGESAEVAIGDGCEVECTTDGKAVILK